MESKWTEEDFKHFLAYITAADGPERAVGKLEKTFGPAFSPFKTFISPPQPQPESQPDQRQLHFDPAFRGPPALETKQTVTQFSEDASVPSPATALAAVGPLDTAPIAPAVEEEHAPQVSQLITYLEKEVQDKELEARSVAAETGSGDPELHGHRAEGQEALDMYVLELVAALRDFPYVNLEQGREVGAWLRDEVVAPTFRGRWDFYSNRKRGAGFDIVALTQALCGQNGLIDSLRHVQKEAGL